VRQPNLASNGPSSHGSTGYRVLLICEAYRTRNFTPRSDKLTQNVRVRRVARASRVLIRMFSLRNLCVLCVSAVKQTLRTTHRRDAESAEMTQRIEVRTAREVVQSEVVQSEVVQSCAGGVECSTSLTVSPIELEGSAYRDTSTKKRKRRRNY
jgi:hypothetical protein